MTANALLDAHGMVGTFYIISNAVGRSGFMTWAQIQALQASGDEIGGHGLDWPHPDLTKLSTAQATAQVCDDRVAIQSHGLTVNDFDYPVGAGWDSASVRSIVQQCGYSSAASRARACRATAPFTPTASRPPTSGRSRPPPCPTTPSAWPRSRRWSPSAENHGGGTVTIVFHEALTNMAAFLDWLQPRAANGTVTKTMTQALHPDTPPPPPRRSAAFGPVRAHGPRRRPGRLLAPRRRVGHDARPTRSPVGAAGTYSGVTLGAASLLPADTDKAAAFSGSELARPDLLELHAVADGRGLRGSVDQADVASRDGSLPVDRDQGRGRTRCSSTDPGWSS